MPGKRRIHPAPELKDWRPTPARALAGGGARSIWIVLSPGRLATKTPIDSYLSSLDFLGFSRSNLGLSMGYTRFSRKKFSSGFSPAFEARGRNGTVLTVRKRRIAHRQSFLIS